MEDIVAVEVTLDSGKKRYFITWGRIQHILDPSYLEALILEQAHRFHLQGKAVRARVCSSLQEASSATNFFEGLFKFSQRPIPFGPHYQEWRRERAKQMGAGKELSIVGPWDPPIQATTDAPRASHRKPKRSRTRISKKD